MFGLARGLIPLKNSYECNKCKKTYSRQDNLLRHQRTVYKQDTEYHSSMSDDNSSLSGNGIESISLPAIELLLHHILTAEVGTTKLSKKNFISVINQIYSEEDQDESSDSDATEDEDKEQSNEDEEETNEDEEQSNEDVEDENMESENDAEDELLRNKLQPTVLAFLRELLKAGKESEYDLTKQNLLEIVRHII